MRLYKYLSEARVGLLESGLIRFTQPQAFNDPFELKPNIVGLAPAAHLEERFSADFGQLVKEEYDGLPEEIRKVISFEVMSAYAESQRGNILEGVKQAAKHATPLLRKVVHDSFEKHVGVLSLTESADNLLMWAHYANSHQGFVVEFESEHGFFNQRKSSTDELRHLRKVDYSGIRPGHTLAELSSFSDFLVKSREWAYEREWRMLMALADSDEKIDQSPFDIHLFQIPFDAIRAIYVGARASTETKERIVSAVNTCPAMNRVVIYQMRISDEMFELHADRII